MGILERGYEVVCHAGDEACEKKRDHGRFAALSEEVHDGEEGPCDAEAEDDELRPHAAQRRVVGDFHEEEARGYAEGGRDGFRVETSPSRRAQRALRRMMEKTKQPRNATLKTISGKDA